MAESKVGETLKAAAEVAYKDAIQPAAREFGAAAQPAGRDLGQAVSTVASAVNAVLAPIRAMCWAWNQVETVVYDYLEKEFEDKQERLKPPSPVVAVPVLQSLAYTASEPNLREMYLKLLAASMDLEKSKNAHPAYVETIKQLTPDESRIVRLLHTKRRIPTVHLKSLVNLGPVQPEETHHTHFTLIPWQADCQHKELIQSYLDNICRLGLAEFAPVKYAIHGENVYEEVVDSEAFRALRNGFEEEGKSLFVERSFIQITSFGLQFADTCLSSATDKVAAK